MSAPNRPDPLGTRDTFATPQGTFGLYRLDRLESLAGARIDELPYSIRLLLESALRHCGNGIVAEDDVRNIVGWRPDGGPAVEIPFIPARVVLQDFTGVPAVVDLAAMRSAMHRLGGDPKKINPLIPVDLVIDHSVQVDYFGAPDALEKNVEREFERNRERYEFLRWGQKALANFQVVPPNIGIVHQVNLEFLARGVLVADDAQGPVVYPDTLVGTDSHTTMINALGVLGWGVGGIEAEAVMLGQPLYMLMPEVIGFRLDGRLPPGTTATDLVLTVTEILRREKVVGKFVEFFGPGVSTMSLADRATIANMAPEYGATMGFFPVDAQTLDYLRRTGRPADKVELVERYSKEQRLFRTDSAPVPRFTRVVELDLGKVEPSLAGPKRPQDRVPLARMKEAFRESLQAPIAARGFELDAAQLERSVTLRLNGDQERLTHGSVVIAAITSCTNTSNPSVMLAAGLLAQKAAARGLRVPPHVKTSLAPGSRVVSAYLDKAGLTPSLEQLGFHTVGYGCTTCIGNSGPLPEPVAKAVTEGNLVAAAVLSGNRNFEGRVNPMVKANYLASPPLVVAYALAGTTAIDLLHEPLGTDRQGQPVFLRDVWPSPEEVDRVMQASITPEMFVERYRHAFDGNPRWNAMPVAGGELYQWDPNSTYIQEPPFLEDVTPEVPPVEPIRGARCLLVLGDSVTTDHISPAGSIAQDGPAGAYLMERGVAPRDFNSYGSRRGNDRVMVRGTFANIRLRNHLAPGTEGGWTRHQPDDQQMTVYDAALRYAEERVPLIVLAGAEYGTGSSRDWAAKGTYLLGVRAVIAGSYERIHRSNLIGMGVLPLEFLEGESWQSLGLTGKEAYDIPIPAELEPRQRITVTASGADGRQTSFTVVARIDSPVEIDYYRNGGILQTVLRKLVRA